MSLKKIPCRKKRNIKLLIGSCIRSDYDILELFLKYLFRMDTTGLDIKYLFIDDNTNQDSIELLQKYNCNYDNIDIIKSKDVLINTPLNSKDVYSDHKWNFDLVDKVSNFKNFIINYAIDNNFDYLFLTDSDGLYHQHLIKHLLSKNKHIISPIIYTKWNENFNSEYSNVWLFDQYSCIDPDNLYGKGLFQDSDLFNMLSVPGTYNVGYLSMAFLFSRKAMIKGVNFSDIDNIYYFGEDRHISIRAAALGFNLYVDTNYPGYHIYNQDYLNTVKMAEEYGYTDNENLRGILSQYMYMTDNRNISTYEKLFEDFGQIEIDNFNISELTIDQHYVNQEVTPDNDNSVEQLSGDIINSPETENDIFVHPYHEDDFELKKQIKNKKLKKKSFATIDTDDIFSPREPSMEENNNFIFNLDKEIDNESKKTKSVKATKKHNSLQKKDTKKQGVNNDDQNIESINNIEILSNSNDLNNLDKNIES